MHHQVRDEEKLLEDPVVQPEPLQYCHIWRTAKTWEDAFEFDPLMVYLTAGDHQSPVNIRTISVANLLAAKIRRTTLTVTGGRAFVIALVHPDDGPRPPFERLFDFTIRRILELASRDISAEQRKRVEEVQTKMAHSVKGTLGDRVYDMVSVEILATEPASQGHGYGSALVQTINDLADAYGNASYLFAITKNEPFYNFHGYQSVAKLYVGEGNPSWAEKPVAVHLMVREAQAPEKSGKVYQSNTKFLRTLRVPVLPPEIVSPQIAAI